MDSVRAGSLQPVAHRRVAPETISASVTGLPPGLSPSANPVICRHFFGVDPPQSVSDLRFRRDVEQLHRLPARVTFELLSEIGATGGIQSHIEERTAVFAGIEPDALTMAGGDEFPPPPIHRVPS